MTRRTQNDPTIEAIEAVASVRGSVSDDVLQHLQRLIVTGVLAPGERLASERALAAEFDVSRSALREALSRLEAAGLVQRRQGSGTRVSETVPLSSALAASLAGPTANREDAAEFRTVVEPQIARLAAARIDETELAALQEILDEEAAIGDPDRSVSLDVAFHAGLARAARNPLLASLSDLTVSWTVGARVYSHLDEAGRRLSHAGHARILRALGAHSPDGAEAAMRVHLDEIAEVIERMGHSS